MRLLHSTISLSPQREERQKEEKFVSETREIFRHRQEMIAEKQRKQKEREELEQQLLQQRITQDQKVINGRNSLAAIVNRVLSW